jgi:hypothetical protein
VTTVRFYRETPQYRTRFPELDYQMQGRGNWRVIDNDGGHAVGPSYASKIELLADLPRYAREYGCANVA